MSRMLPDAELVTGDELIAAARLRHHDGWRFITASCVRRPAGAFSVLYHFERDELLQHLRLEVEEGSAVPSIGSVYPAAFLVENEMIELQGLAVSDLTVDYHGRLYRDFDGPEGFVIEPVPTPEGGTIAAGPFETAAALRLDACVPVTPNGREIRAPGTRVPDAGDGRSSGNGRVHTDGGT